MAPRPRTAAAPDSSGPYPTQTHLLRWMAVGRDTAFLENRLENWKLKPAAFMISAVDGGNGYPRSYSIFVAELKW